MLKSNAPIIVGLTTYDTDYLRLSLTGLAQIKQKFILIIHNDNPDVKVGKRDVRKWGYQGKVWIINTSHSVGKLGARLEILKFIARRKFSAQWAMFINDTDILTQIDIPDVTQNTFAIIQSCIVIKSGLIDVLRAMKNPALCVPDGENVVLVQPNMGLRGTPIRMTILQQLAGILGEHAGAISDISEGLTGTMPTDEMMWAAVNIIAKHYNRSGTPIFMDGVNMISVTIDNPKLTKAAIAQNERAVAKYSRVIQTALSIADAAPCGQDVNE